MKRKTKFRNVTFLLAICAGTIAACTCVLIIADKYHSAQSKFNAHLQESQGWEAFRRTKTDYFKAHEEEANNSKKNLEEAKSNFWVQRPKQELVGIFALVGVGSALAGYLAVWIVAMICYVCVRTLFRGLVFCIKGKGSRGKGSRGKGSRTREAISNSESTESTESTAEKLITLR
ncbi:MAG: hypothetical protein CEE38_18610 [Planctomycetes bacterium B3_Pla]|nr:MAG: hypothetical protein CEE38_18610 [Planctomycetes bacterium B3_Pla]